MFVFKSVNVHQGDSSGETGHFYTFLNLPNVHLLDNDTKYKNESSASCNWYLFNDEIVRTATLQEVFDNNFGGTSSFQHACILLSTFLSP
jgi:hypothetical protein